MPSANLREHTYRPCFAAPSLSAEQLLEAVLRVKPRLHVFGHIHYGYGTHPTKGTLFVNAAVFTVGDPREPIVVELGKR